MALLEGDEILGSPYFTDMYARYRHRLATADASLSPGASQDSSVTVSMNPAYTGPDDARAILREVGVRSQFRLGRIALEAANSGSNGRTRRRLTVLAKRHIQAVESSEVLDGSEDGVPHPEVEDTKEQIQHDIEHHLGQVVGWLGHGDAVYQEYALGDVVLRKLIKRDAPGLAGTAYWELVQMAEEM